jgi:hypothetical protein
MTSETNTTKNSKSFTSAREKTEKAFENKQQEWFISNILTLLENNKTELTLLTRRVTELEMKIYQILRLWQEDVKERENQLKSVGQNR